MRLRPTHIPRLLIASYLLTIAVVAVLGFVSISGLITMRDTALGIYRHPFAVSNAAMDFQVHAIDIRKKMLELAMTTDRSKAQRLSKSIETEGQEAMRHLGLVRAGFLGDMRQIDQTESLMKRWAELRQSIGALVQQGDTTQATQLATHEGNRLYEQIEQQTDYVVQYARQRANRYISDTDDDFSNKVFWLWTMLSAVILLIVGSSMWVIRKVSMLHDEVELQARHDPLTGIANRRFFVELAQRELSRAQREGWATALLIIDLDHFKTINDDHGHLVGDQSIQLFCAIAREQLRESDVLGRIGGDEFVALLPQTTAAAALRTAERLRNQLAAQSLILPTGREIPLTISVGIATAPPALPNIDALLRQADKALYLAKEAGRNRCEVADPALFSDTGTFHADALSAG